MSGQTALIFSVEREKLRIECLNFQLQELRRFGATRSEHSLNLKDQVKKPFHFTMNCYKLDYWLRRIPNFYE
jgi:hypothetical protein